MDQVNSVLKSLSFKLKRYLLTLRYLLEAILTYNNGICTARYRILRVRNVEFELRVLRSH